MREEVEGLATNGHEVTRSDTNGDAVSWVEGLKWFNREGHEDRQSERDWDDDVGIRKSTKSVRQNGLGKHNRNVYGPVQFST